MDGGEPNTARSAPSCAATRPAGARTAGPATGSPIRLMLVGELDDAMGLAVEMTRGTPTHIVAAAPDGAIREAWENAEGDLVVVDIAVNLAEVIARLRGERAGTRPVDRAVAALVGQRMDAVERALILQTLENCEGNRTNAASILGISVRTMRNKLRSFLADGQAVPPSLIRH